MATLQYTVIIETEGEVDPGKLCGEIEAALRHYDFEFGLEDVQDTGCVDKIEVYASGGTITEPTTLSEKVHEAVIQRLIDWEPPK